MKKKDEERLKEIIYLALKLHWIDPQNLRLNPFMLISSVKKCMTAMVDDIELSKMRNKAEHKIWPKEVPPKIIATYDKLRVELAAKGYLHFEAKKVVDGV